MERYPRSEGEPSMRATPFDFHAPTQLDEVLELLDEHEVDAKLLAGGMSLVPMLTLGLARPSVLISLNHFQDLDYVEVDGENLRLGSMVRHEQILTHRLIRDFCPALSAAASHVGDVQVRHRGTIGGSVAHADPAADYLPVLYLIDATIRIAAAHGEREVKARDFIVGSLQTILEPNEVVVEVIVPKIPTDMGWAYERLARIEGNFAIVNAAASVNGDGAVVTVGAAKAAPVVVRTTPASREEMLSSVGEAAGEACADAYADLAGGAEYRRAMAGVYATKALESAFLRRDSEQAQRQGEGPQPI
jgi:carbon-monoxide dehydrogenase medium subunit